MTPHAHDPHTPPLEGQVSNPQEGNATTLDDLSPRPKDPRIEAESPLKPAPIGPAESAATGLADEADPLEYTAVDPHEVRARVTRRGTVQGLELDSGTGVVWIPQYALPDLRRRLYLAQQRFTAMSGPVPGKRRRRPASAR